MNSQNLVKKVDLTRFSVLIKTTEKMCLYNKYPISIASPRDPDRAVCGVIGANMMPRHSEAAGCSSSPSSAASLPQVRHRFPHLSVVAGAVGGGSNIAFPFSRPPSF